MSKERLLAGDLYPNAATGDKLLTIRKGLRDFEPGEKIRIVNVDNNNEYIERTIAMVSKYLQSTMVPIQTILEDGFSDYLNMVELMKRFYPDFDESTPVTVIKWSNEDL